VSGQENDPDKMELKNMALEEKFEVLKSVTDIEKTVTGDN